MFAEGALRLNLQLMLVVLHLATEHASTVFVLHFDFVFELRKLLLIFALLLPFKLQYLAIGFFLQISLLFL